MAWRDLDPWYEGHHPDGRPAFRIVEDDGCYIILMRDNLVPESDKLAWVPATYIGPEIYRVFVQLPPPNGALYDIERDGPLEISSFDVEALVEQYFERRKEAKAEFQRKLAMSPS